MALWAYADYESQPTAAEKLTRLDLHISEVSAEVHPDISVAGRSRGNSPIVDYLAQLRERRVQLERLANLSVSSRRNYAQFGKPN